MKQGRTSFEFIIMNDSAVNQSHLRSDLAGVGIKGGLTFISRHLLQINLSNRRISDKLPECRESLDILVREGVKQTWKLRKREGIAGLLQLLQIHLEMSQPQRWKEMGPDLEVHPLSTDD